MLIKCKKKQTNRTAGEKESQKEYEGMVYSTGGTLALLIRNAIFYELIIGAHNGFPHKKFFRMRNSLNKR